MINLDGNIVEILKDKLDDIGYYRLTSMYFKNSLDLGLITGIKFMTSTWIQ